jgi:hypothetical protein
MYPAQANSPETSLSGALTAAGTTVNVVDGSVLPEAPNLLTIGADGSTAETVLMTAKNGNVLTVTRAQNGTTARAWSAGDVIARYFTAADQTAMQENIKKLNEGKAEKAASPTAGHFAGLDASGNPTDSGKKPGDFAAASHTHTGKADKVSSATSGHFAGLDSSGNLTDSGKKPGDFAAASHTHTDKADKAKNVTAGHFAGLDSSGNLTDSGLRQSDRQRQKAGRLCQRLPRSRGIRRGKDFLRRVRRRLCMGERQHIRGVSLCRLYRLPRRDGEPRPRGRVRCDRGRERKLCTGRSLRERDGQNLRRDKADGGYHGAEHYLY